MPMPKIPEGFPEPTPDCTDKVIPIELAKGGNNSFYHACKIYSGRSNYAVCLHTIDAVQEQRITLRSECQAAIENRTCPAMKMRKLEVEANRALWFEDRKLRMERSAAERRAADERSGYGYGRQRKSMGALNTKPASTADLEKFSQNTTTPPAPKKKSDALDASVMGRNILGDAVNNLMKESRT